MKGEHGHPATWCVHYRSPNGQNGEEVKTCDAGVTYAFFHGVKFDRRPCFLDTKGNSKPDAMACAHILRPTAEEIATHAKWVKERGQKVLAVIVAIEPLRKKYRGSGGAEVLACPGCAGKLRIVIARSNGHASAKCETPGCVEFME